ncbi:synaptotagmin-like protein 4 isoform X7 [Lytechinus variegatus]|uniref:synaptotagmin-like protein 4 isoform X7 n=1 Tax=Lytechinus variegatus TaxID=7654 RepID=UPI001BB1F8BB|nr:synaptotagmin-like protein 4 isoform X7 [Lytechinus variegatus]
MINLEHLTEEERKIIMDVLQRDEQLRQTEQERVKTNTRKLKTELHELRKKSAVKVDDDSVDSGKKVCARCREPLGTIFNSGEVCPRCQHKVCSNCKVILPNSKKWLCTICNKQLQIRLESGEAFGPKREGQPGAYGTELVKMSLGQSKTVLEPNIQVNGGPQSPADSGFHGRGTNVPSVGGSTTFDEDYPSDVSYEQSMVSGVESIGPSASQRGSIARHGAPMNHDDSTTVRNDVEGGMYGSADITMERVSPSTNRRSRQSDVIQHGKPRHPDSPVNSRKSYHGSELSEDDRSYRSDGSGGRGVPRHPPIPTIAIQDIGDSSFSESEYYSGSERLHRQALEANMYRDPNTGEWVRYQNGQLVSGSDAVIADHDLAKGPSNGHSGGEPTLEKLATVPGSKVKPSLDNSAASAVRDAEVDIEHRAPQAPRIPDEEKKSQVSSVVGEDRPERKRDSLHRFTSRSSVSTASTTASTPVEKRLSRSNMLHKGSTSSLTSLYSTGEEFYGKYPITGDVSFGLGYNFKTNVFEVKIGGCRDLVPIDAKRNKSDPYIKTYLLPDKSKNSKRKTRTKKGTINPNYSENLKYPISQSELETRTLSVAVWHYDRFGHNMFLGEVLLPLDGVDLTSYPVKWHQLMTRVAPTETKPISYKGDIVLALMFETLLDENKNKNGTSESKSSLRRKKKGLSAKQIGGSLKVHIKEAKNLTPQRVGAVVNPYIKVYLEPDRSKNGKKKTATMRNTLNPSYEQSLEFPNVTEDILKERALEVGVWDSEIGSSSFLGGVRLGSGTGKSYGRSVEWQDSTGIEIQLWQEMLRNHNQWVEACLTLRASFNKDKHT